MKQIPSSKANSFSVSQEIPRIYLSLNVHYRVHKSLPLVSVLSHINPVLAPHPIS
jgi:hypothetical protein